MSDIEYLHRVAYEAGADLIEHAVSTVALFIHTRDNICTARANNPAAYPIHGNDTSEEHFARRIVAELLDAGWSPPDLAVPRPKGDHPMTGPERVDGRIRDLAELCSRHGTPCADGLLAEIGRLRIDNEQLRIEWQFQVDAGADLFARAAGAEAELERCEGDLGVAIREAAAAREALKLVRPMLESAQVTRLLNVVDAALDQRPTR